MNSPSPRVLQRLGEVLDVPYGRLMELAGYLMPDAEPRDRSKEREPMAEHDQATNAELLRRLDAIRGELAELKTGQQQLARALAQLTEREP